MPTPSFARRLLAAAVLGWLAIALIGLIAGAPLGHDESAFALAARGDAPPWLYRSRGVVAIAELGVALGGADWQLRLASALLGAGGVLAVFAVGRAAFDARTGAWAAAVIAGAHPMTLRSAELIGDLPATACVLAGVAALVHELDREGGPRWRIALAAPAFAAAFYLRYGSAPVIALAGLAALALWWRPIARRPLPVIAAAALFALLVVSHLVHSLRTTGSLLGILEVSSKMPRRAYPGEGLVTYLTSNPFRFYGALVAPLVVAGLAGLATARRRAPWFLGIVALGQLISIGIQSHAQPRYVFVASCLLVVLGVALARAVAARWSGPVPGRIAGGLVIAAWLGAAIAVVPYQRFLADARAPVVAAAGAIRRDAAGRPCLAAARVVTQLMWYARCEGFLVHSIDRLTPWPTDRPRYLVSLPHAALDAARIAAAQQLAAPVALPVSDDRARVWVVR